MSEFGYKRLFGPCRRHVRSTSDSRPSSDHVRFAPDNVGFTPRCGPPGRCPRSSGFDPIRTSMIPDVFAQRCQVLKTLGHIHTRRDPLQARSIVAPAATCEHGQDG